MAHKIRFRDLVTRVTFAVFILAACVPAPPVDEVVIPRRASPTPSASPAAQPTAPEAQPASAGSPFPARLAVVSASARVLKPEGSATELGQAQSLDLELNDGIEVVRPEGGQAQSYSLLHFPDVLNVELFGGTRVFLTGIRQGEGGSPEITLDLDDGHLFVHPNEERDTRVTVRVPYATIRTLTNGAEFDVCRDPLLTCVVVRRGVVEVVAQDRREIVKAGEAGLVLRDQPPSPAICAPAPTFTVWEERYRHAAGAPALQEEVQRLPQRPCPVTADGLPFNARVLYRDDFDGSSSGWHQGKVGNFVARYVRTAGPRYYQVEVQGPADRYLAFAPPRATYADVNVDVRAFVEAAGSGDVRYGLIFRRSGDRYYAFAISPATETWYFLKSSSSGVEVLRDGLDPRMRGPEAQDTLRVETYGSTFLFFINGRFIDWINDPDYRRGEVGLFVESIDTPVARIGFNWIAIWDIETPVFEPARGENCFNAVDDDGDGLIDQADPDCQIPDLIVTAPPTSLPVPTRTPGPAGPPTSEPPPTQPPLPTVEPTTVELPTIELPIPTIELPITIGPPGEPPGP